VGDVPARLDRMDLRAFFAGGLHGLEGSSLVGCCSGIAYISRGVFSIDMGELSKPCDSKSTMSVFSLTIFFLSKVSLTRAFPENDPGSRASSGVWLLSPRVSRCACGGICSRGFLRSSSRVFPKSKRCATRLACCLSLPLNALGLALMARLGGCGAY
jgi:hypothetical protein